MWTVVNLVERFSDVYEFYVVTRNHDGKADFIGHDVDADHKVDYADYDKDHDGVFEKRMYDDNNDGWLDRTVWKHPRK